MNNGNVLITDHSFASIDTERTLIEAAGARLSVAQCRTEDDVIAAAVDATALLVQWAPITERVLRTLQACRVVVRYGIGVDNIDLAAARRLGVPVANVPDYCIDEVADHTFALALALGRQLVATDRRLRGGEWKITPPAPMPAFREMNFVTLGLGRIGRAVLARARTFGFAPLAYDPNLPDSVFADAGVRRVTLEEGLACADVLSLHLPLTAGTRHLLSAERLSAMRPTAILVNTSRGGLVDTIALAAALQAGNLAGAGLDVFEEEPLAPAHPLRACGNAVLTSHTAWYSEASVRTLQRLAAEEVARALRGEPLKNPLGS
ncbi:MAG TPA: C-terminal binding protein [Candidatus Didemnitutus sp.]|jgi:D-3-phosphoglycerate dehydrogenase